MAEETPAAAWKGKATAELKAVPADQAWPHVADFCNLHKFFPNLDTCRQVEGEPGKPGLVRYCSTAPPPDAIEEAAAKWVKERLVMINPAERWLSYEIVENNMGFGFYVATFRVLDGDDESGSKIEWSYVADAVEGMRFEDFEGYVEFCLKFMAKQIEACVCC